MALADMYKTNNVSYYESGAGFSGIFTDTLANLLANGDLDYSIFLNCGCDWTYLNTGCKGNHFSMYPDWVGGVLAIRQGPAVHDIKYVGSAVMSKTNTAAVFNAVLIMQVTQEQSTVLIVVYYRVLRIIELQTRHTLAHLYQTILHLQEIMQRD